MLEELIDLSAGLGVMVLPLLLLAVPAIILFVVLPALLLAPLALIGAVIAVPPYLIALLLRRRRGRQRPSRAIPRVKAGCAPQRAPGSPDGVCQRLSSV